MKERQSASLNKAVHKAHRLVVEWLFGDVAFAVIPILTIALINKLLGDSFKDFLLIKEWSFATIVFLGVSIRRFIRLKVEIQKTPRSYKLYGMVQILVLLLIASVLVLSFVILGEKGVIARQEKIVLGFAQLLLFGLGLYTILMVVVAEEQCRERDKTLPDGIPKDNYSLDKR